MIRSLCFVTAVMFAAASPALAKSDLAAGNYVVSYSPFAGSEQGLFLIKVEHKGGKDVVEVLDPTDNASVANTQIENRKVLIVFKAFGRELSFDGAVSENDPKVIIGSFGDDSLITRGRLTPTNHDKLDQSDRAMPVKLPEPMMKLQQLNSKVQQLSLKLRQAKEDDAKADLKKQIEEAQKESIDMTPKLHKEVVEKHADNPAVIDAVMFLLAKAEKSAKPEEVAQWLKVADTAAKPYGARYRLEIATRYLSSLTGKKGFELVALDAADRASKGIVESTSNGQQSKVLKALRTAQEKAGKTDLAKQTQARIDKIEVILDKEYLAKVPPFKPTKFAGRKTGSDRVVVMELFTGAQCPPCVAADVGFDGLQKSYKPTDLILIQYHMHIPGPDPLTNADSEARWKYYGNLNGTPSTLFNGKVAAGGGGGMAGSEDKYKEFKKVIDPILEESTPIKITGSVSAKGEKLFIKADVEGIKEPNENLKLRFVLVEETIKYVGGNGLRFHHQVVRALPGGVEGTAIKDKTGSKAVEVDLAEVRKTLTSYLDNFAKDRPFPFPDRPLALKNLRVIALVQDDKSKEILQAVQLEVPETK